MKEGVIGVFSKVKRSFKDNSFQLKLLFLILIIFSFILAGCGPEDLLDTPVSECQGDIGTQILSDSKYLCVQKDTNENDETSTTCILDPETGEEINKKTINQMFANLYATAYNAMKAEGVTRYEDNDFPAVAAISAAYFFGDIDETCNDAACKDGSGFDGDFWEDGEGVNDDGGTATGACTNKYTIPSQTFHRNNYIGADYYGLTGGTGDNNELAYFEAGVGTEVPLIFECFDSPTSTDRFNLYPNEPTTKGAIVVQETTDDEGNFQILSFYCDGEEWHTLSGSPDSDNDGVPDALDCAEDDPNIYLNLSIFTEFDESDASEICGDGKDNLCTDSGFYSWDIFDDYYEDYGAWSEDGTTGNTDSCDYNPEACKANCLFAGNSCDYLTEGTYDETTGETTYDDTGAGYCCGAGLIDDLGNVLEDESGTSKACLAADNENIVGGAESAGITCDESDDWCWVSAEVEGSFKILTLKENGQKPYDIVSNNEDWYVCDESLVDSSLPIYEPGDLQYWEWANRYYCYDQGDRYVWAECLNDPEETLSNNTGTIKHRDSGDALFALADYSEDGNINLDDYNDESEFYRQEYLEFTNSLDFTGYDFLEFYVTFETAEIYPESINLQVFGAATLEGTDEETVTYYDQNVLGYAVNAPLIEEGSTIHIKVPIGDWKDIINIKILSQENNDITIRNVYLSKANESPKLCSGIDTREISNWIDDLDYSDTENAVSAELICQTHYGDDAWLGTYETYDEVDYSWASCCGNGGEDGVLPEYYAGTTSDDLDSRGCFNGEVVYEDDTIMNVEYEVEYGVEEYTVDTEIEQSFEYNLTLPIFDLDLINTPCTTSETVVGYNTDCDYDENESSLTCDYEGHTLIFSTEDLSDVNWGSYGVCVDNYDESQTDWDLVWQYPSSTYNVKDSLNLIGVTTEGITGEVSYEDSPLIIYNETVLSSDILATLEEYTLELFFDDTENENVRLSFFIPEFQENKGQDFTVTIDDDLPPTFTLQVIAETNIIDTDVDNLTETQNFTYPCTQEECIYGLAGLPPYYITNSHPDLYDMYFITGTEPEDEFLIENDHQEFNEMGNLKVKKISQQVIYSNESFFGCQAADYIENTGAFDFNDGDNLANCQIKGSYFCSFQDDNLLINSWSDEAITSYGYEEVEEYEEGMDFDLHECVSGDTCAATDRNSSSPAVPGQNFISNADFNEKTGDDIDNWELIDSAGQQVEGEVDYLSDNSIQVPSGTTLYSERVAIYPNEDYSFSQSSSCTVSMQLVDKDGNREIVADENTALFNSGDAVYARVEVGVCSSFSEPMLQLIDDLGSNDYHYDETYPIRKGAACCPDNMCWNGYYCVDSMSATTYLSEDVNNRTYRCIEGEWTHIEPQFDWNEDEFGFCESETQCFVTSSLSEGANFEATPLDFYTGTYPTCLDDGEYIFDNLCANGTWTSRTKFIASKLLEFGETDDYVLSCDNYQTNLLDYDSPGYSYANYVEGEGSADVESTEELETTLTGEAVTSETVPVCFPDLETSETGRRLINTDENGCVNNVCVLKYKSGDDFDAAFGLSMNLNTTDDNSFLIPLGYSSSQLEDFCPDATNSSSDWVQCSDELWYSKELNSLIYARSGISISTGVVDSIIDWFSTFFSTSPLLDAGEFIENATNFNKVYLLSMEGGQYVVQAVEELSEGTSTIQAEYSGFETPVCDYVFNANEDVVLEYQWPAEPEYLVNCTLTEDNIYQVFAATNTDYWWPQLTGKLRVFN